MVVKGAAFDARRYPAFRMDRHLPDDLQAQVSRWIDDLAGHAQAADAIGALGDAAVPALRAYLATEPQPVPHARAFAVAMLARLPGAGPTAALREALRAHPLESLAPPCAESECVVKNDAMEELVRRGCAGLADDVAFGVHERLRAAVDAVGRLELVALAGALVDLLDDDVLAEDATTALVALGTASARAIEARLDAWLTEAEWSARRRLALIRALRVLHRTGSAGAGPVIARALQAPDPALRAAAALLAWRTRRDQALLDPLVRGAIGFDRELADDCRSVLDESGVDIAEHAQRAWQRNAEPDLYGGLHTLQSRQKAWLRKHMADPATARRI